MTESYSASAPTSWQDSSEVNRAATYYRGGDNMSDWMTASDFLVSIRANNNSYKYIDKKRVTISNSAARNFSNETEDLRKKIKVLNQTQYNTSSKDTVERKIKKFIKSYNGLIKEKESYDNEEFKTAKEELQQLVVGETRKLKKVGIVFNKKNKNLLELDEDKFNDAKESYFQALFSGEKDSFGYKAKSLVEKANKVSNSDIYYKITQKTQKTTNLDDNRVGVGATAYALTETTNIISYLACNEAIQNNPKILQDFDIDGDGNKIDRFLSDFQNYLNTILVNANRTEDRPYLQKMKDCQLNETNKSNLEKLGFSITEDGMTEGDPVIQFDNSLPGYNFDAFEALFTSDDYAGAIIDNSRKIFVEALGIDKSGVKISEYV